MSWVSRSVKAGGVLLSLVVISGCASAVAPQVTRIATDFETAAGSGDVRHACELLSERARKNLEASTAEACERALKQLTLPGGPVESVETWGDNAQVRMGASAMFLSRFASGWRVTAAGCRPLGDQRYDCVLEG